MPDRRTRYYQHANGEVRKGTTPPHPSIRVANSDYQLPVLERAPLDLDHTYAHRMERAERASKPGAS